jgi:Protein of unknown function (DUF3575)
MRYKLLLVLFLGIPNLLTAQMNYGRSTWFIKANATSMIDIFTFPTVQLSVEKQFTDYISLSAEGGYQFYNFHHSEATFYTPRGFRANIEFRYYLSEMRNSRLSDKLGRTYLGLRPFYSQNQFNTSISYKLSADSPRWIDDDFGVKNQTYGVNCIIGFQKSLSEKILIDLYAGAGIMDRNVTNTGIQYIEDAGYLLAGTEFIKYFKKLNLSESSGIRVNFLFGLRMGFKLYKS